MAEGNTVDRGVGRIDRCTILAANDLFRHLSAAELEGLARYTRLEKYRPMISLVYR